MYNFEAIEEQPNLHNSSLILSIDIGVGVEIAQFRGSLLGLFGEPNYKASNIENAFQYTISAMDTAGETYMFTVYEGASGLGIGGQSNDPATLLAAKAFIEYVKHAPPAEYEEKLVYSDTGSTIRYGCKDGVGYFNECLPFADVAPTVGELPQIAPNQLDELTGIDFSNIADEDERWFWKKDLLNFSSIHFPTIRDLMRKDVSRGRANPISLEQLREIARVDGFEAVFGAQSAEMALVSLVSVWAWHTTEGKATKKKKLDCTSFAWTISRAVYGLYGGNFNKNHARANALFEAYEDKISSPEDTLRFFYAVLDIFKLKRLKVE
ncbi:hypothetical protein [Paenibacillus sp. MMS18-CY102]|uniref:hypothetical protein n=1 Tax=Paenibacillus sp. MMS18-CY102 TaxID=2682849 RepID=UPI001365E194|nr:hypothetical protein [Paenibacillus sp. MMS18-CY102]MWC29861.1 hypothetical protein [Paenibacillus sp. MMS18-CY102]